VTTARPASYPIPSGCDMHRAVHVTLAGALLLLYRLASIAGQDAETPRPTLSYIDQGACPGEYCRYGPWTLQESVPVYDTWHRKRRCIAQISVGERMVGRTGLVVTVRPRVIRMDRDLPEHNLKKGDIILTYAYRGEGFSAVWFKGKYYPDFDITFTKWPDGTGCGGAACAATYADLGEKIWWAEVQLQSGGIGWIDMTNAHFENTPGHYDLACRQTAVTVPPAACTS
jgi:hypothetical protein